MRGLDGASFQMQGELLARLQLAHQMESVAQQTRAQAQAQQALQRLREQVQAAQAGVPGGALKPIQEEGTPSREGARQRPSGRRPKQLKAVEASHSGERHVDVRV